MHAAQKDTDEEEETDRMRLPEAPNDNMLNRRGSSSSRHASSPPKRNKKNAKQVRNRKTFQVPQHVEDWYVLILPPLEITPCMSICVTCPEISRVVLNGVRDD